MNTMLSSLVLVVRAFVLPSDLQKLVSTRLASPSYSQPGVTLSQRRVVSMLLSVT
jgi:hypothetical protein